MTKHGLTTAAVCILVACEAPPSADVSESPSIITEDGATEGESTSEREVIFRGVGQEPGWIVRIFDDEIVYEADYGGRTVSVRTPEPVETEEGRRYETTRLTVEIADQPCSDTMSGAGYVATVTIIEGERMLQGCGGDQTSSPEEGV